MKDLEGGVVALLWLKGLNPPFEVFHTAQPPRAYFFYLELLYAPLYPKLIHPRYRLFKTYAHPYSILSHILQSLSILDPDDSPSGMQVVHPLKVQVPCLIP